MPEFLEGLPFAEALAVLWAIAMLRGQAMYWLGRVVTEQALRRTHPTAGWWARAHRWLSEGGADAGIVAIRRWGLVTVPISYLTIGLQSMIQAAAGVLRIPWWKYSLAQIPGAIAWAAIYATFGFFTWVAISQAVQGNPTAAIILGLAAVALVAALVVIRRRSGDAVEELGKSAGAVVPEDSPAPSDGQ